VGIPVATPATLGVPPQGDQANMVIAGAFAATGVSAAFCIYGGFNFFLWGPSGPNGNWNATVQLERSFDGGTTWLVCGVGGSGAQAVYTSAGTGSDVSITGNEVERGMAYRVHCTAYSTTVNYRLSTTGVLATTSGIPS
jgi:hypothetical protein